MVYHIIWYSKRRRKVLVGPVHDRLKQIVEQVIEENGCKLLKLAIEPDHVHLFLRAHPSTRPTAIARKITGRSSHLLREEFPPLKRLPSLWTRNTFYSTAGNVSRETIEQSIARQSKR